MTKVSNKSQLVKVLVVVGLAVVGVGAAIQYSAPVKAPVAPAQERSGQLETITLPEDFDGLFQVGTHSLVKGRADVAEEAFRRASILKPEVAESHLNLGFARLDLSKPEEALQDFNKALELNENLAGAFYGVASAFAQQEKYSEAVEHMKMFAHLLDVNDPFVKKGWQQIRFWNWEAERARMKEKYAKQGDSYIGVDMDGDARTGVNNELQGVFNDHHGFFEFPFKTLAGEDTTLANLKGKTVIVNMWASWCAPCRAEMPSLEKLYKTVDPDEVAVVGISLDEDGDFLKEFMAEHNITFPNVQDPGGLKLRETYGIRFLPHTYIFGPDGNHWYVVYGARDWMSPEVMETLAKLKTPEKLRETINANIH